MQTNAEISRFYQKASSNLYRIAREDLFNRITKGSFNYDDETIYEIQDEAASQSRRSRNFLFEII